MSNFKNYQSRPNYSYAIISVALVLFLLGFFGFIVLQGQQVIKFAKEKVEIIVELKSGTNQQDIDKIKRKLSREDFAKPGSVKYIAKEEGAKMMQEEFGEEFMKLDLPNPLYDILTFNVKSDFLNASKLSAIRSDLKQNSFVNDVFYQENLVNAIAQNIEKLSYYGLGIAFFFIIVAITLIHNTVKLSLFANRFLIKNMELVGASWEFISRPYLRRSFKHGFLSALIAIGLLIVILIVAYSEIPELNEMNPTWNVLLMFIILVILGVLLTTTSTWYVVKKYLKMRVDDLY
jgi:cell division transport system permease protein